MGSKTFYKKCFGPICYLREMKMQEYRDKKKHRLFDISEERDRIEIIRDGCKTVVFIDINGKLKVISNLI